MSGSPVFASFTGVWDMKAPYIQPDPNSPAFWSSNDIALGHTAMEFVGTYSGRVLAEEGEAALGLCWKESTIKEICGARKLGKNPHL